MLYFDGKMKWKTKQQWDAAYIIIIIVCDACGSLVVAIGWVSEERRAAPSAHDLLQ